MENCQWCLNSVFEQTTQCYYVPGRMHAGCVPRQADRHAKLHRQRQTVRAGSETRVHSRVYLSADARNVLR
jgi:hypothetical protein